MRAVVVVVIVIVCFLLVLTLSVLPVRGPVPPVSPTFPVAFDRLLASSAQLKARKDRRPGQGVLKIGVFVDRGAYNSRRAKRWRSIRTSIIHLQRGSSRLSAAAIANNAPHTLRNGFTRATGAIRIRVGRRARVRARRVKPCCRRSGRRLCVDDVLRRGFVHVRMRL